MTKKEAINRVKAGAPFSEIYDPTWEEALNTLISAASDNEGDLISRQAVLELLQMKYFGKDLYKAIYELPSVESKREWTPVSERNPDIYKRVEKYLITDDEDQVRTACFINAGDACWWDYLHVVAWQPLPEPYKGER